jgi:ribosomal protein L11 methyltransferase
VVVAGGEAELARLLDLYPAGVEEVEDGYAVYADVAPPGFEVVSVEPVSPGWDDAWRGFHHGVVVGRLWVGPPWEDVPAGLLSVVIDPGRAFGTGAHATTRLCLELLQEVEPTSVLDVGCGSGVLAIAAVKLGFAPVTAVDVDPVAVEVTRANAAANSVTVVAEHTEDLPQAGLAVANIALGAIELLAPRIDAQVLIAAGYLERDEPRTPGWRRVERRVRDGWAADLLEFRP